MTDSKTRWSPIRRAPYLEEVFTAFVGYVHQDFEANWDLEYERAEALREHVISQARRRRERPVVVCVGLFNLLIDELGGKYKELTPQEIRNIARCFMYCSACAGWNGDRCKHYPKRTMDQALGRQFFCLLYSPVQDAGEVMPKNEPDLNLSKSTKLVLYPLMILLIILLVVVWLVTVIFRLVWRLLRHPLRWLWTGLKWIFRGIARVVRGIADIFRWGAASVRDTIGHWRRVLGAARSAMSQPPGAEQIAGELDERTKHQAEELEEELEEVRREAERVKAELRERVLAEHKDRDDLQAELEARVAGFETRITELEERLTGTGEKLRTMTKRAQMLGRLVRQQQEILDGKARSARRLAVSKRKLGRQLKEAAELIPEEALISPEEALNIEHLLEIAESELDERDEKLAAVRADRDEALAELETYDQQLAIAQQRIHDLEGELAGRGEAPPAPQEPLPRRIGETEIIAGKRFTKEFEEVPTYLQPFVAERLRLLLSEPNLMEQRTHLVGEPDLAAYRLPKKEGLRKCRLNVKYRMFLVPQGDTVELVSVSKHA